MPEHGHPADLLTIKLRQKMTEIREAAKKSPREVPTSLIVSRAVGAVESEAILGGLPSFRYLSKQGAYSRRDQDVTPAARAKKRENIEIPTKSKVCSPGFLHP